ncbi:MAG: hypothetical protein ILP18_00365 [Treponema sp.]|nr:hypothetical protein [Treponema sp.]
MRPTRSKLRLAYHKKLRALERKKRELAKRARDPQEYKEIPRTLAGYKVRLSLIESLRNKDEGLSEAVDAATSYLVFSDKPFRLCNLKSYRTIYNSIAHRVYRIRWLNKDEKVEDTFFKDKIYQKGRLELLDLDEHDYRKLSPAAQKYFSERLQEFDRHGRPVLCWHPDIPASYLREVKEKLYWNCRVIPDSEAESECKRIDNWLDYKRKCELWHYEGCRTRYFWKDEDRISRRNERHRLKLELRELELQELKPVQLEICRPAAYVLIANEE